MEAYLQELKNILILIEELKEKDEEEFAKIKFKMISKINFRGDQSI